MPKTSTAKVLKPDLSKSFLLSRIAAQTSDFQPRWSARKDVLGGGDKPWIVWRWNEEIDPKASYSSNRVVAARFKHRAEAMGYVRHLNEEEHIREILIALTGEISDEQGFASKFLNEIDHLVDHILKEAPLCPATEPFRTYSTPFPPEGNG